MTAPPSATTGFTLALIRQRHTPFGGAERFLERAMTALANEGTTITLLSREWPKGPSASPVTVKILNPPAIGRLWRDWSFSRAVRRELELNPHTLVQSHERIPGCDLYRAGDGVHRVWLEERRRTQNPLQRLLTHLSPYHRHLLRAETALFTDPRLRAVICNSRMVRDEILRHFAIDPGKLHVIHSGIDSQRFHPRLATEHRRSIRAGLGIDAEAPLFLFVGSGYIRKGVPILIRAMRRLPPAVHLLVVGRERRLERFIRQAIREKVDRRIHFLGARSPVEPYYGAADALVLPTLYDPFPNVALEAMASGLPVITSWQSGASDLIQDGVNGHLADALDEEALVGFMRRLSDPELCRAMGIKARETVKGLTPERMAGAMLALYRQLLSPP
ncbi:MAG: glycosyltransferase family 4 protein [Magnetococcales bacterium]|nr:glycosyltransferase family 4 protein [Magnetococcales bacterium]